MQEPVQEPTDWIDGFLFLANKPILDFLNTRPVFGDGPTELLLDFQALERWLIASGIAESAKAKRELRIWRGRSDAEHFLKELLAFRERLRGAVVRMEKGLLPSDEFIREVNIGLRRHPPTIHLREKDGKLVREELFDPEEPADLWSALLDGTAELLSEPETHRLRQCEACVIHFFDTSKKGSRRWCSMNICGNKLKVAAYQRRKRDGGAV